jgi:NAD(P)H-hydrate epimerase
LKGRYTCITTTSGKTFFNPTGNPGIAKGGSGDVLTGIITSFLAQGYSPFESCIVATYLHGLAGDCAAKTTGNYSMLASDLIENLGNAFLHLLG